MWGVSIIDVLVDILRFDGYKEQKFPGKVKWIIGYPFAFLVLMGLIAAFVIGTILTLFKKGDR